MVYRFRRDEAHLPRTEDGEIDHEEIARQELEKYLEEIGMTLEEYEIEMGINEKENARKAKLTPQQLLAEHEAKVAEEERAETTPETDDTRGCDTRLWGQTDTEAEARGSW